MDSAEQADGEKRVMAVLVLPLERRGLVKPSNLTKEQYADMIADMCSRLAYMTPVNLAALSEQVAAYPSGKDKDRFPIANHILKWAADIQPPADSASPLIRGILAHDLGKVALQEGWAPELVFEVKRIRRWPTPLMVNKIKNDATSNMRRLVMIEERLARSGDIPLEDADWRNRRKAALARCQSISEIGQQGGMV